MESERKGKEKVKRTQTTKRKTIKIKENEIRER